MGVKEDLRLPSNALGESSGKGASKSSGTVNSRARNQSAERLYGRNDWFDFSNRFTRAENRQRLPSYDTLEISG